MNVETKLNLIKQVGEEIITEEELRTLLETKKSPIAYDGFEPSGRIHVAQGILRSININRMTKAGIKFKMWVADWHAWANNKLGGDLDKIKVAGDYFIEVWKASGMDLDNVEFVWANEVISDPEYWKKVMQVSRNSTLKRIVRCGQIMGRKEDEALQASQILYPCMQAADIFHLNVDICQLGMDQRKVNMLAREIGPKIGYWKPVAVHHHMLMGLQQPPSEGADSIERKIELKMSKSKPDTAIFMTDTEEEIKRKIGKAYCPAKQLHENPMIDYAKFLLFPSFNNLVVERPEKFGGNMEYANLAELEKDFASGTLHPMDLKNMVADHTNKLLIPVRKHFEKNVRARKLAEQVESFSVTR